jgi:hypothetical protein
MADDRVIRVEGLFNALRARSNQQQFYSQGAGGLITFDKSWCYERNWFAGLFAPLNSVLEIARIDERELQSGAGYNRINPCQLGVISYPKARMKCVLVLVATCFQKAKFVFS